MTSLVELEAGGADFAAAVEAVCQCYEHVAQRGEHLKYHVQKGELFADALRQWKRAGRGGDSANRFVLQVVACRLEQQLLVWLMQTHTADAAEDMRELVTVCAQLGGSNESHLALLKQLLDALLTAAAVRAFCSDRKLKRREDRLSALEKVTRADVRSVVLALRQRREEEARDTTAWNSFLALPIGLDDGLFNSRSGRTFVSVAEQVISQQQLQVQTAYGSSEEALTTGEELEHTTVGLWELTDQLVGLIKAEAAPEDSRGPITSSEAPSSTAAFSIVANVEGLGDYLQMKAANSPAKTQDSAVVPELCGTEDKMEFSAIEQLAAAFSSQQDGWNISRKLLGDALDELTVVQSAEVLEVHVSFLLSLQMCFGYVFSDQNLEIKSELERRIRRIVNRLTGDGQDREQVRSLVALSAFCPEQVLEQVVLGARADTLHHSFYLEVLHSVPFLLRWRESVSDDVVPVLQRVLRRAMLDVSKDPSLFESESDNLSAFLLALVGVASAAAPDRTAALMEIDVFIGGVFVSLCSSLPSACSCDDDEAAMIQLNGFTILQRLLDTLVASESRCAGDLGPLRELFALVVGAYSYVGVGETTTATQLREKLLLVLKSTIELSREPAAVITLDQIAVLIDIPLLTLVEPFSSLRVEDETAGKLRSLTTMRDYFANKEKEDDEDGNRIISADVVRDAVLILLWRLLWNATLSSKLVSILPLSDVELWLFMDKIAQEDFNFAMNEVPRVHGSSLIQNAVGKMMTACGGGLFRVLYDRVLILLLKYEPIVAKEGDEEVLVLPDWALTSLLAEGDTNVKQLQCQLQSTHHGMRYIVKCWGLVALSDSSPSKVVLVESLRHVLLACDAAIASSQSSVSGTLFCIQWTCFLASAAHGLELDVLPIWSGVQNQLELLLLRLLHNLAYMKQVFEVEACFSQRFVASWLAQLPAGEFDQVSNFLRTKANA